MKTFIQYLNEISPQLAARAFDTFEGTLGEGSRSLKRTLRYKGPDAAQRLRDQITRQTMRAADKIENIKVVASLPPHEPTQDVADRHIARNIKRIKKGHFPNARKVITALSKHPGKHGDQARAMVNDPKQHAEKNGQAT